MTTYSFTETLACNMCGATPARFRTLGLRLNRSQGLFPRARHGIAVSIRKCQTCRLIFPDPMPSPQLLSDHYGVPAESYWTEKYFEVHEDYFRREIAAARRLTQLSSGGRALDIGAGVGKAMLALQNDGWDVHGIEPSSAFFEKAVSGMGISPTKLTNVTIEDAEFDAGSFDFITFGAVLEHLYDPAACIARALHWLKPGGVIQMEVPSSDYLWHKILNAWYRLSGSGYVSNLSPMHSPFHLYEFSLASFQALGKRQGFTIAESWYEVASGRFIPGSIYWFLRPLMEKTDSGMQMTVFLGKRA